MEIESASNKYTFVWRGSVETYDTRLRKRPAASSLRQNRYLKWESRETQPDEKLSVEEFQARTARIQKKMNSTEVPQENKEGSRKDRKENPYRKYLNMNALSISWENGIPYSKTDEDATFMRMKRGCYEKQPAKARLQYTDSHGKSSS